MRVWVFESVKTENQCTIVVHILLSISCCASASSEIYRQAFLEVCKQIISVHSSFYTLRGGLLDVDLVGISLLKILQIVSTEVVCNYSDIHICLHL